MSVTMDSHSPLDLSVDVEVLWCEGKFTQKKKMRS